MLQRTRNGSCKAIIKAIQFQDQGEWTFLVEVKEEQNKTIKRFVHNVQIGQNGNTLVFYLDLT